MQFRFQTFAAALVLLVAVRMSPSLRGAELREFVRLHTNDVVAFLGGANVVAAQESGHLETLLTLSTPGKGIKFRNLGWEGDTVYVQPRDFKFPALTNQLERVQATVLFLSFGQTEALQGLDKLSGFTAAYEKLLDTLLQQTPRIVLITPPPFEKPQGKLPDGSENNACLGAYAGAIRELAERRNLPLVDLYGALGKLKSPPRLTDNGFYLTASGQAEVARLTYGELNLPKGFKQTPAVNPEGKWIEPEWESVRKAVIAKNQLWFNFWRPMNWAFLGGDRTEQPSSRDHRDPSVRWFPTEMDKYLPLIEKAEADIDQRARQVKLP